MNRRDDISVSGRKRLMVAGCDLVELAAMYGTPFCIFDEAAIRQRCRAFVRGLKDSGLGGAAYYAAEVFAAQAALRIIRQEGMGLAATSIALAHAALQAGYDPGQIILHGAAKPRDEIESAVALGIGRIVVDSIDEIEAIQAAAKSRDSVQRVMLRINPGLAGLPRSRETLWGVTPGGRFGVSVEDGEALRAVKAVAACPNLRLSGLHTHIGSQIFSPQPYIQALEKMTDLAVLAMFVTGCEAGELNIGGGFPVRWHEEDDPPPVGATMYTISQNLKLICERKGMSVPAVNVEPGRAIVAEAGTLVSRVCAVKRSEGFRPYAVLDLRAARAVDPAFSNKQPVFTLANRQNEEASEVYALADRTCSPDGVLTWDAYLPEVRADDLVAQLCGGTMPWSERGPGSPAVLMAQYGSALMIEERPDAQYYTQLDRVPARFNR